MYSSTFLFLSLNSKIFHNISSKTLQTKGCFFDSQFLTRNLVHKPKLINENHKHVKGKLSGSSTRWVQRQRSDPFVKEAQETGKFSRSFYKLKEIQKKYSFLCPGQIVLELGSVPGGWTQFLIETLNSDGHNKILPKGTLITLDINELPLQMETYSDGFTFIQCDFMSPEVHIKLNQVLNNNRVDVILSDMSPPSSGMRDLDHLRLMELNKQVFEFSLSKLSNNASFLTKISTGGMENDFKKKMDKFFEKVEYVKPSASRSDSREMYLFARNFRNFQQQQYPQNEHLNTQTIHQQINLDQNSNRTTTTEINVLKKLKVQPRFDISKSLKKNKKE